MVEISSPGSGEGRGWVTGPGYSTELITHSPVNQDDTCSKFFFSIQLLFQSISF